MTKEVATIHCDDLGDLLDERYELERENTALMSDNEHLKREVKVFRGSSWAFAIAAAFWFAVAVVLAWRINQ